VITGKNQHALVETEIPTAGRDEVLISVQYAGICSTDLDVLSGNLDYYKSGWASYPVVPGHEFSGIVAAVGENVRELKVGDRVVGECIMGCGQCFHCLGDRPLNCRERKEVGVLNFNGAYSRYIRMPARFAHKLSDGAPLEKACLIEPLAVSIRGVKKLLSGEDNRPRNAAVLGHGTIGNLCAQLMAARGHRVTVFDRNPSRLEGIGNSSIRGAGEIAGLEAYDLIIEATGRTEVLKKALLESPTGAKVLLLGLPYSSFDFNFENIVSFDKTVVGSVGSSRKDFDEAVSLYTELDLESLTKNIFPLEDYETAWILHREGRVTKAILKINGG
jgi:2-desacetyl-2-hydroxyethyl bacteriochlorophyllide A dehydrogenase